MFASSQWWRIGSYLHLQSPERSVRWILPKMCHRHRCTRCRRNASATASLWCHEFDWSAAIWRRSHRCRRFEKLASHCNCRSAARASSRRTDLQTVAIASVVSFALKIAMQKTKENYYKFKSTSNSIAISSGCISKSYRAFRSWRNYLYLHLLSEIACMTISFYK